MIKEINSVNNPIIKLATSLKNKKDILKNQECFVEGEKIIDYLISKGFLLSKLFILKDKLDKYNYLIKNILEKTYLINNIIANKISHTQNNAGIFAIFKLPQSSNFNYKQNFLVLQNMQDPTNLGAIIRSAVAFNFTNIILINSVYPYLPKVTRSSSGYVFNINFINLSVDELKKEKEKHNFKLLSASLNGDEPKKLEYKNFGLIIGNEGSGITEDLQNLSDANLTIAMSNDVESLNAAVSASILMNILKN